MNDDDLRLSGDDLRPRLLTRKEEREAESIVSAMHARIERIKRAEEASANPIERPDVLYKHRAESAERMLSALRGEHEKALTALKAKATTEEAELHAFAQRIMLAMVEGLGRPLEAHEGLACYSSAAQWLAVRSALVAEGRTLAMHAGNAREAAALALARWGADRWERVPDDANGRILGTHYRVPVEVPAPEGAGEKIKHSEALDDKAK